VELELEQEVAASAEISTTIHAVGYTEDLALDLELALENSFHP